MAMWNANPRPFEAYRQQLVLRRWQTPCPRSTTYDDKHQEELGEEICQYKHFFFHWQGRKGNEVTLISDSIGKWIRNIAHLQVQAIPGLDLRRAFTKMCLMELNCRDFLGVILHCGTNDFSEGAPPELVVERTAAIVNFMQQSHPNVKVAVGIILPRPVDTDDKKWGPAKEERRVTTNEQMKRMCRQKRVLYADFQKAARSNDIVQHGWYAKDRLHLNTKGIAALGEYYQGIANTLMDQN